jgi:hypothetical protein
VPPPGMLLRLMGRLNTLNVLSYSLEVTSRPRSGHTAKPNPGPQQVHNGGSGTRLPRSTCIGGAHAYTRVHNARDRRV